MQRVIDWFLGLGAGQKVLAVLAGVLLAFSASYLVTTVGLSLLGYGDEASAPAPSPPVTTPAPESFPEEPEDMDLKISRAAWEGDEVVVEGSWDGDVSSVHCDLFAGDEDTSRVTDWWDREVYPVMSWRERTFKQAFVEAEGRRIEDPIDPEERYRVVCWGAFAGGWALSASSAVGGTPPEAGQAGSTSII